MKQEDITKYSLGSGALLFAFLISISGFKTENLLVIIM